MKKLLLVLFICASMLPYKFVSASHFAGSEIYYAATAVPDIYIVTFKAYRDCSGINLCSGCPTGSTTGCTFSVDLTASAGSSIIYLAPKALRIVSAQSGFDIVQLCNTSKTVCSNCGTRTAGSFSPGIELYTFQDTINLTSVPVSYCTITISSTVCCRNANLLMIANPSTTDFYTEAKINRCIPFNSSPVFYGASNFVICAGADQSINITAVDPDGDLLTYAFGEALSSTGTPVYYNSPYSRLVPFPYLGFPVQSPPALPPIGVNIDTASGDIRFRPQGNFIANLVVEVKQWRIINGINTLLGTTRRDQQIYSTSCLANSSVTMQKFDSLGISSFPDKITICPNERFCRIFVARDNTISDTTDISWTGPANMPGATLQKLYNPVLRNVNGPRQDSVKICWTAPPNSGAVAPYTFVYTAVDRVCPIPSKFVRSFLVYVRLPTTAIIRKTGLLFNSRKLTYTRTNTVSRDSSLTQWMIETSPGSNSFNTINSDSINSYTFPQKGRYKIKLNLYNTTCGYSLINDSIDIGFLNLITLNNVVCKSDSSGSVVFATTGTSGPVQYKINNRPFQSSGTFMNLPVGAYVAVAKDSLNQTDTLRIALTEPSLSLVVNQVSSTTIKCKGDSTGTITLSITNGKAPYLYKVLGSAYQTNSTITNLKAGTQTFMVKDSNNCMAVKNITVAEPLYKTSFFLTITQPPCSGNTGGIVIENNYANTPHMFRMDTGAYSSIYRFFNLDIGTYSFAAKDINDCEMFLSATLINPAVLRTSPLTVGISCTGKTDGKIIVNTSGGTPNYFYKKDSGSFVNNNTFAGLAKGKYIITVRDFNYCITKDTLMVTEPTPLIKTIQYTNAKCLGSNDGIATLTLAGGTPPYTYNWNTIPQQHAATATNLPPGKVKVTGLDSNLCSVTDSAIITYRPIYIGQQICIVTVDTFTGKNKVVWNKIQDNGIASYRIYSGISPTGPFTLSGSQPYSGQSVYMDNLSLPSKKTYYAIKVMDSCNNESSISNSHSPISLSGAVVSGGKASFNWDGYIGSNFLNGYRVLRSVNGAAFTTIAQLPFTEVIYFDTSKILLPKKYVVELLLSTQCKTDNNIVDTIRVFSNVVSIFPTSTNSNNSEDGSIEVFPNPTSGTVKINAVLPGIYFHSIEVINMLGQTVKEQNITGLNRETTLELDELNSGIYYLLITASNQNKYWIKIVLSGKK